MERRKIFHHLRIHYHFLLLSMELKGKKKERRKKLFSSYSISSCRSQTIFLKFKKIIKAKGAEVGDGVIRANKTEHDDP